MCVVEARPAAREAQRRAPHRLRLGHLRPRAPQHHRVHPPLPGARGHTRYTRFYLFTFTMCLGAQEPITLFLKVLRQPTDLYVQVC